MSTIANATAASLPTSRLLMESPQSKSQQGVTALHGVKFSSFLKLLAMRPECQWKGLPRLASVGLCSVWNSLAGLVEDLAYGAAVERTQIEQPPVFILGHWRSGTTLLHNLMTLDPQFAFANTYQVLFANHFLATERVISGLTAKLVPATRPMDNMPAGWHYPQEDEVALMGLSMVSPYLMVAFPNQFARYEKYIDLESLSPVELQRWQAAFLLFMKKLTYRYRKPIVLKSPSHTYRVPQLLELFPTAKFVYIYRDPYAVLRSTAHLRKAMFSENSFTTSDPSVSLNDAITMYRRGIERYESTKAKIPAGRLHEVRFESLEEDPLGQMRSIYENLDLPGWDQVQPVIENEVPALRAYRKNSFKPDPEFTRRVHSQISHILELYGYSDRLSDAA